VCVMESEGVSKNHRSSGSRESGSDQAQKSLGNLKHLPPCFIQFSLVV